MTSYEDVALNLRPKYALTQQQQARLLLEAIRSQINKKPRWTIDEIRQAAARLSGKGITNIKPTAEHSLAGYVGEIVIYYGVNEFFADPRVRRRYGYQDIETRIKLLIPADIRGKVRFEGDLERRIRSARETFYNVLRGTAAGSSQSITDFFLKRGRPIESKAKVAGRVFLSTKGEVIGDRPKERIRGSLPNQYIQDLVSKGHEVVVGWTFIYLEYQELEITEYKKIQRQIRDALREIEDIGKRKRKIAQAAAQKLVTATTVAKVEGGREKVFAAIGVNISAFVPTVIDQREFQRWLGSKVNLAQEQVDEKTVAEIVESARQELIRLIQKAQLTGVR